MLVNPISFRLSVSIFWKSTWNLYNYNNYKYLFYSDLILFEYLLFFFRKLLKTKKSDYYISHLRLYRLKKNIIINFYYYNPSEDILSKQLKDHFIKKKVFKIYYNKKKRKKEIEKKKKNKKFWRKFKKLKFWKRIFFVRKKFLIKNKKKNKNINKQFKQKYFKMWVKGKQFVFKKNSIGKIKLALASEARKVLTKHKLRYKKLRKYFKKFNRKKRWKRRLLRLKYRKENKLKFIKLKSFKNFKNINLKKIIFLKKIILRKKKLKKKYYKNNFFFLFKLNFLKYIYNLKYIIYNIYIYILYKFLKKESKKILLKLYKNFKLNFYKISLKQITSKLVGKYLKTTLRKNYSIWKGLNPIIADLNKRILLKQINGFKILVSGRFKRAQRATYLWRKNGSFLIATPTASIDYELFLYRTKYGVCAIKIWITRGSNMFKYFDKIYPLYKIFFFINKKKYFILKKNEFFFNILLKKFYKNYSSFNITYIKSIILKLLYKYLYINIFIKNLFLNKVKKLYKKIILPQFCVYKICLDNYIYTKYLKIKPYIKFTHLKRMNIRNSYKLRFINKNKKKLKLKQIKYKINLKGKYERVQTKRIKI